MDTLQVNTTLNIQDIIINPEYEAMIPPLRADEYQRLKDSISEVGLYEPIIVNNEFIVLDGHHRFKACLELDVLPRFTIKVFETKLDEEIYVIETNVIRRQLNQYQLTIMGLKLEEKYATQARENMLSGKTLSQNKERVHSEKKAAKVIGLKQSTYYNAKYVLDKGTASQVERFKVGKKRAGSLYREIKREEAIQELRAKIPDVVSPDGPFDVIVVDPPWPYGNDDEYDADGNRVATPYPELSIDEIMALEPPASKNCILWLWTTNAFMHEAYHVLEAWGFEPKTILTWVKDRMGVGAWLRGKTEHCILSIKGKPTINLTNQTTMFFGVNKGHSCKPDEFYDLVEEYCIGTKVDWFARETREGWVAFGTLEGN